MSRKLLAVDDDRSFLNSLKDVLVQKGYEVLTLNDPGKVEEEIENFEPDIMVLDVFMPKRSGFKLLTDFNERGVYQDIPKVLLTCLDDDVERMVARSEGVDAYVTKPIDIDHFLKIIEELLN